MAFTGTKSAILAALATLLTPDGAGNVLLGQSPAQFDVSLKAASTAWVNQRGQAFKTQAVVNATTTLTAAAHAGCEITVTAVVNVTLPLAATCAPGTIIHICSQAAGAGILRQGTDVLSMTPSNTSAVMGLNDTLTLMSDGSGVWLGIGGTLQLGASGAFASSIAGIGYQKLPSGLIIQWGSGGTTSGNLTVTLPLAFPNGQLAGFSNPYGGNGAFSTDVTSLSQTAINVAVYVTTTGALGGTVQVSWMAIGH